MADTKIRVLIVDDHEVVRSGYCRLLENTDDIVVVAEASDGEQAYQKFIEHQPDVVVMDLNMPGIGGLDASRRILARDSSAKILVFSVHESEVYLQRTLDAGILGYISKRSASKVMLDAIRVIAKGDNYIGQEMMPFLVNQKTSPHGQTINDLSPREFEVFRLLAEGKSVNDIAALLNVSPKTAGHHYTSIKQKLAVSNSAELTRFAIRMGVITP